MAYLDTPVSGFPSNISRIKGYRPIEVTLTFKDGSKALPDSIGTPRVGTSYFVGPEILTATDKTVQVDTSNATTALGNSLQQSGKEQSSINFVSYATSQKPILVSSRGAAIRLFWHDPNLDIPSSGDVPISPDKVYIDSKLGTIDILETAPQNKTAVVAYYYAAITDSTPKILNDVWDSLISNTKAGLVGFGTYVGLSQVYPVTRNRTDYLYGRDVELRQPNLDRTSPDYYPVYEYKVLQDGSLQFAVPLHPFSDRPAKIEVKYQSLGIEPRLLVDLNRDEDSGISPEVPNISISVETFK